MTKHAARPLRSTKRLQLQNLTSALPKWYSVKAQATGPTLVSIYDEIGFYGVSASDFMAEMNSIAGDIEVHLNSPGGDVFDGIAIYNQLKNAQQRGQVRIIVDGLAASAASFIAMAASPGQLEMAPHSRMMIHDGFGMAIGNAADMREMADLLDDASNNIASMYAERTGKPQDYWRSQMRTETWYTDQQAVAEGLADGIHGQAPAPSNDWDLSVFASYAGVSNTATRNVGQAPDDDKVQCPTCTGSGKILQGNRDCPDCEGAGRVTPEQAEKSKASASASATAARDCPQCHTEAQVSMRFCGSCGTKLSMADESGWVQDPDGSWRFDPDGDGDDDSTPEGDTDHDYFDPQGNPVPGKTIPPCPGNTADFLVRQIRNADIDDSPWDASKAWAAGAKSDDPAAFYKGICAGRKSGDPSTQDAWALPYKYSPSSKPNAAGVRNALARIGSTQGLTNQEEAQALLERLMKQVNPDYDPDDLAETGLLSAALLAGLGRG